MYFSVFKIGNSFFEFFVFFVQGEVGSRGRVGMSPPTFSEGLEQDLVQRVGTKLKLKVSVEPDNKAGKVSIGLQQDLVQPVGTKLQLKVSVEPDNKQAKSV